MLFKSALLLVILRFCYGYQLIENADVINSRTSFVSNVENFLDQADNGISKKCNNHWNEYIRGLKKKNKIWALKMFDASSKIPSGILQGSFVDLGFFDECLDVEGTSLTSLPVEKIYGKYCVGTLPLNLRNKTGNQLPIVFNSDVFRYTRKIPTSDGINGLKFGICTPNSCSALELREIFAGIGINMAFHDELCQTKFDQPELDAGAIATLCFLGVILFIMVCCTVYDAILQYLQKKPPHSILTAFSITSNGKKLIATSNSPNQISCLHGIRVISTMWIILGHRYTHQNYGPIRNALAAGKWMEKRSSLFIMNAPLAVDTFFLMSGLVVVYVYLSAISKGVKFNVILFYVHRYLRLTPVLAVIILIHVTLVKYFGSGPVYPTFVQKQLVEGCEQYWWKALLYIQNYGNQESNCVPQSWYLSVDTQLFFLSPIILIPLKRWPKLTLLGTGILTLCTMLTSFLFGWFKEYRANIALNFGSDFGKWYYGATQTRAGPWLIGIVLGYYIYQVKQKTIRIKVNTELVLALWAASFAVLCTCVFTGSDLFLEEYDKLGNSMHLALVRPAWAVAVGCIIFACVIGYGGPVNWFLSLPVFQVLSKFTYTLYLLHEQLIIITLAKMRYAPTFSNEKMMYVFWGDFAFTLALAVLFTLAFESPMIIIEQTVFGRAKKKEVKPSAPEGSTNTTKHAETA